MNLIDEEDGIVILSQFFDEALETLFKVPSIARAGENSAHVEGIDFHAVEGIGDLALVNAEGQPLGDRSLAYTGVTDEDRIVLSTSAQDLHRSFEFFVPTDQGVNVTGSSFLHELRTETTQRVGVFFSLFFAAVSHAGRDGASFFAGDLTDPMGDVVDEVKASDPLLFE